MVVLLAVTIVVVWMVYAYLHGVPARMAGLVLRQVVAADERLYSFVETYFPSDVKYKIRGAITDDLGQRSLFLLLLTATVELTLYSFVQVGEGRLPPLVRAWKRGGESTRGGHPFS